MTKPAQQIPAGWSTKVLADICDILIGGTPSRDKMEYWDANKEGKNIWISIRDLSHGGKYISDSAEYISDKGVNSSNVKPIPKGNVLMSFKLTIGKVAISDKDVYTNEAIAAFLVKDKSFIDSNFLYYALPCLKYDIDTAVKGATLNKEKLKTTNIIFPPLSEQTKIAAILSKVDEEIEKVERIIAQTEKLKKGLMQKLLTKGIGHTKFKQTELGEIPEEWEIREFIDFATLQRGFDLPKQSRTEGVFPLVSSNGITDNISECRVKAPGVVTGRSGTIGNVFFIKRDFWPLNTTLYIKDFHENNEKFVYYAILQFDLSIYLTGTGVPTLNRNVVHKKKIAIPPIDEQKKIVIILEAIDEKLVIHKRNKSYLLKLKKGLMNDLLSGNVRVNNN